MKKIYTFIFVSLILGLNACGTDEGGASRIVLGTGNVIEEFNDLQYRLPFNVQVTDNDANPAANTKVTVSVKSVQYFKGQYVAGSESWGAVYSATCAAEDTNNNGVLDAGEDINNNGRLEPTNPATITAHSTESPTYDPVTRSITTDENGFGYFALTYPQSEALWVTVQLTATAAVSGTENDEVFEHTLFVRVSDLDDISISPPGGTRSKYGVAGVCTDPD